MQRMAVLQARIQRHLCGRSFSPITIGEKFPLDSDLHSSLLFKASTLRLNGRLMHDKTEEARRKELLHSVREDARRKMRDSLPVPHQS